MPKKILAVIVDSRGGMMFNSRRQTRDAEVIADMMERFGDREVFAAPYSARLFESYHVTFCEKPMAMCGEGSLVFLEDPALLESLDGFETVVMYRYGITYPADSFFEYDLTALGYKRISKDKFSTSIHQKVEREVYKKVLIN